MTDRINIFYEGEAKMTLAARGTGVRLTASETSQLGRDDAIETAAFQAAHEDLGEDSYR